MWYHIPPEFCPSSQATEDSTPPSRWLLRALKSFAMWRSKRMPLKFWRGAWRRTPWLRRLCGRILHPSTHVPGAAEWTSSLPDGHALRSASPGGEREQPTSDGCGERSLESSGSLEPPGSTERTSAAFSPPGKLLCELQNEAWREPQQNLFSARGARFSQTWPTSGTMRNGSVYEHPTQGPRTDGSGSSSWGDCYPTPRVTTNGGLGTSRDNDNSRIEDQAATWATPKSSQSGPDRARRVREGSGGDDLVTQVSEWPTPVEADSRSSARHTTNRDSHTGASLTDAVRKQDGESWPTPSATEFKPGGRKPDGKRGRHLRDVGRTLDDWPTPECLNHEGYQISGGKVFPRLGEVARKAQEASAWPTPVESDSRSSARSTTETGVMHPVTSLTDAVRKQSGDGWPTPAHRDYRSPNAKSYEERGGGPKGEQLNNFVAHKWPTPPAQDGDKGYVGQRDGLGSLSLPGKATEPGTADLGVAGKVKVQLNPDFVDCLQGLPPGWTDIETHEFPVDPGWPPGPADKEGWEEYIAAGGPAPAVPMEPKVPNRVDRLRLAGNGVVRQQAALALARLVGRMGVTDKE